MQVTLSPHATDYNSYLYSGTGENYAIKGIASLAILSFCISGSYCLVHGVPLPRASGIIGVVLIGGGTLGGVGIIVWYHREIHKVKKLSTLYFEQLLQDGSQIAPARHQIAASKTFSPKCFFEDELLLRVQGILQDPEHLDANLEKLNKLLIFFVNKQQFLAEQLKKLNNEKREAFLSHTNPELPALVQPMMISEIADKTTFQNWYSLVPHATRKAILITVSQSFKDYFWETVKKTPDKRTIIEEIVSNHPAFLNDLATAFNTEFETSTQSDESCAFLKEIYPFFKTPEHRTRAFCPHMAKVTPNNHYLEVWTKALIETRYAMDYSEEVVGSVYQSDNSEAFFEAVRNSPSQEVIGNVESICKETSGRLPLLILNSTRFSQKDKQNIQQLSVLDIGELIEQHPEVCSIWLQGQRESTVNICLNYTQNEPSRQLWKILFHNLHIEQLIEWFLSDERRNFSEKYSKGFESTSWQETYAPGDIAKTQEKNRHFATRFIRGFQKSASKKLKELQLETIRVCYDLYLIWNHIASLKAPEERLEVMKRIYAQDSVLLSKLITAQSILDGYSYDKQIDNFQSIGHPRNTSFSSDAPDIVYNSSVVYDSFQRLGLIPNQKHNKIVLRQKLMRYWEQLEKNEIDQESYHKHFQDVQFLMEYLNQNIKRFE